MRLLPQQGPPPWGTVCVRCRGRARTRRLVCILWRGRLCRQLYEEVKLPLEMASLERASLERASKGKLSPRSTSLPNEQGVDVVVAAPGRAREHLSAGTLRLDDAAAIVLDEADLLLSELLLCQKAWRGEKKRTLLQAVSHVVGHLKTAPARWAVTTPRRSSSTRRACCSVNGLRFVRGQSDQVL